MDGELFCNIRQCRKALTNGQAWVTACSHMFCKEDGEHFIGQEKRQCPVCEQLLNGKLDIVRLELNPSEGYKSMVLCGLRPEIIMDICSRAITFWSFQNRQELIYKENKLTRSKEKFAKLNTSSNKMISNWQLETEAYNSKLMNAKNELHLTKKRCEELNSLVREKSKQLQTLQSAFNMHRHSFANNDKSTKDNDADFRFSSFELPVDMPRETIQSPRDKTAQLYEKPFVLSAFSVQNSPRYRVGERGPRNLFSS